MADPVVEILQGISTTWNLNEFRVEIGLDPEPDGNTVYGTAKPIVFRINGQTYAIHKNALTDWASVPALFRPFINRLSSVWRLGAFIHDHLYAGILDANGVMFDDKILADAVLRVVSRDSGANRFLIWPVWAAVRFGGGMAWNKNRNDLAVHGLWHRYL